MTKDGDDKIRQFVKQCPTCQRFEKEKKYDKFPPKNIDIIPWEKVCIDLVDPYTVTDQKGKDRICNTMIFVEITPCSTTV